MLWTDVFVPFPFGKGDSGVLANYSLCGTEATLSLSASLVCLSFSAEACAILHALCCSRQHQQVCYFSSLLPLSDSRSVLPLCPLIRLSCCLKLSDRSGSNCLYSSSVLSGYNKSLDTRFFRETTQLMKLAKQRALLVSSAIRCTLFSFIFHIHSCFSRTGGVMFHLNSLTHRFVQFPPRNLCFSGRSLLLISYSLGLAESRILPAAPANTDPGHLSSHSELSSYGHFAALALWRRSVSLRPRSRPWGIARLSGLHGLPPRPPGNNNNNNNKQKHN